MNDLKDLQRFAKKTEEVQTNKSREVWCYTRVSTKDQESNYSLENQLNAAKLFAKSKGYNLVHYFGGTYESGKDDFTRKEFGKMLDSVKKAKQKPFAILVYKMNRFSRSGGSSVSLAVELIEKLGVNLIEITSDLDTTTPKGQNELFKRLLAAKEENLNKLEHTIPGMKSFIRAGNWLGTAPFGYDHYGPRVKDFSKREYKQRIVLNETGKLLRQAWEWKMKGEADYQIEKRLKTIGVKINRKRLGEMWKNLFYCGVIDSSMLNGEIVQGNHEPMVSPEVFKKVNDTLNGIRPHEYETHKNCPDRPLNGYLFCHVCKRPLCGYEAKKGLHYYKCQECKGISINANTPKKVSKNTGVHQLFISLLESYEMDPTHIDAFKKQVLKVLDTNKETAQRDVTVFKRQLTELENKKEALQERYALEGLDPDLYKKFMTKIEGQIVDLRQKYEEPLKEIPNLDSNLNKAIDFSQNVSKYWLSGSLDIKRRIQRLVFPEGLILDTQNRRYLTSKMNTLFSEKQAFISVSEGHKKRILTKNSENPDYVAGTGFEPMTFGL